MHGRRPLPPFGLCAYAGELERQLLHAVDVDVQLPVLFGDHAPEAVVLPADALDQLLEVLDLLDGRHAAVRLLGELALDIPARTLGAARRLGRVALDLALAAGVTAGVLPSLAVGSLLLHITAAAGGGGGQWELGVCCPWRAGGRIVPG